jgi:hypothetical protein
LSPKRQSVKIGLEVFVKELPQIFFGVEQGCNLVLDITSLLIDRMAGTGPYLFLQPFGSDFGRILHPLCLHVLPEFFDGCPCDADCGLSFVPLYCGVQDPQR